jgi:hypothetical protein
MAGLGPSKPNAVVGDGQIVDLDRQIGEGSFQALDSARESIGPRSGGRNWTVINVTVRDVLGHAREVAIVDPLDEDPTNYSVGIHQFHDTP